MTLTTFTDWATVAGVACAVATTVLVFYQFLGHDTTVKKLAEGVAEQRRPLHNHPDGWPTPANIAEHMRVNHPKIPASMGGAVVATYPGEDVLSTKIWPIAHELAHGGSPLAWSN
jgi:hypothetical protein